MNYNEVLERLDQMNCVKIERLFWMALQLDNSDIEDVLKEIDDKRFRIIFPEIAKAIETDFEVFGGDEMEKDGIMPYFLNRKKLGLLAEISVPICDNFTFEEGNDMPISGSIHEGYCRITHVYAENLEELLNEIEKVSNEMYLEFVAAFKAEASKNEC